MPAIADIIINNGEATPVAKTFEPVEINSKGVALNADMSGGVSIGFPTITTSNTSQSNGGRKVRMNVSIPVLEVASASSEGYTAVPKVAYTLRSNHEFILPGRSDKAEREDLLAFAKNLLATTLAEALVEDLKSVY